MAYPSPQIHHFFVLGIFKILPLAILKDTIKCCQLVTLLCYTTLAIIPPIQLHIPICAHILSPSPSPKVQDFDKICLTNVN